MKHLIQNSKSASFLVFGVFSENSELFTAENKKLEILKYVKKSFVRFNV